MSGVVDANWVGVAVTILGCGVSCFTAVKLAIARLEERQKVLKETVSDHEDRLRGLERGPLDYSR